MSIELAYLGGYFDGEGMVSVAKLSPMKSRGESNTKYMLELVIASTDKAILDLYMHTFGGSIKKRKKYKEHHKQCWCWRISGDRALETLIRLKEYLKVKYAQALVAIDFQQRLQKVRNTFKILPASELEWREQYYQNLRAMKKVEYI